MKKKYYLITIQNIFEVGLKKDIIAEEKNGILYDILLGNKIYMVDNNYFYFDNNQFINEGYSLIGINTFEISEKYVLKYFQDMNKDILLIINEIKNSIKESLKADKLSKKHIIK